MLASLLVLPLFLLFFFFNDTATTEIYTLSLHDALPIWIGHLVPDAFQNRRHLECHRAGHDHEVGLARAGPEDFRAEARDIETRSAGCDHLDGAAGQAKSKRPDGRQPRPVEHMVNRGGDDILFKLVLNEGCHATILSPNFRTLPPDSCLMQDE